MTDAEIESAHRYGSICERRHLSSLTSLEKTYDIQIKDEAFESLFKFFDAWRWHLDENPTGRTERDKPRHSWASSSSSTSTSQEQAKRTKGAYYTKPDVTGYMAASTILPALADRFVAAGLDDPCILLSGSGDTYLHDSILHGVGRAAARRLGCRLAASIG